MLWFNDRVDISSWDLSWTWQSASAAHFNQRLTLWCEFGLCVISCRLYCGTFLYKLNEQIVAENCCQIFVMSPNYCLQFAIKKNVVEEEVVEKKRCHFPQVQNDSVQFGTILAWLRLVHYTISVLHWSVLYLGILTKVCNLQHTIWGVQCKEVIYMISFQVRPCWKSWTT